MFIHTEWDFNKDFIIIIIIIIIIGALMNSSLIYRLILFMCGQIMKWPKGYEWISVIILAGVTIEKYVYWNVFQTSLKCRNPQYRITV